MEVAFILCFDDFCLDKSSETKCKLRLNYYSLLTKRINKKMNSFTLTSRTHNPKREGNISSNFINFKPQITTSPYVFFISLSAFTSPLA